MPYVPGRKTDGRAPDREILDAAVEELADYAAEKITNNLSLVQVYGAIFESLASWLDEQLRHPAVRLKANLPGERLAKNIFKVGQKYDYEGAFLGELNYAITRFIQRVPQKKLEAGDWKSEFRYWIYAATAEALILAARHAMRFKLGIGGVFEDIKDEYKRRVNVAYEAEQILKNGDCYDTPYYTRLIEVVDRSGNHIGYQEIMLKRDSAHLGKDLLNFQIIVS